VLERLKGRTFMVKILVVEDDPKFRAETVDALLRAGYQSDAASSGNQAIRYLREKRYDLLMTDLMMDGGTGFDVLEWVRENAPGLPVIICSSYAKPQNLKGILSTHLYRIVRKPSRGEDLVHQARELMDAAR
jgi:CheY-like chemotaxis protein